MIHSCWRRPILFSLAAALAFAPTPTFAESADTRSAMIFPGARWREAAPESQGVSSAKLKAAVEYMEKSFGPDGAKELVIIRNGWLIHKGPNAGAYHNIWSATKTFTSTMLGLMIADRKCSLDDFAVTHLPALDDRYPVYNQIRLRHLASMSSGYKGEVADVAADVQPWGDPMRYLNPVAPDYEAGTRVEYQDHQVFVLGRILTRLAGEPMKAVLQRRVADPIGITRWDWGVSGTVDGIELNNAAGTPSKSPGVEITPLDLARFGLLYLNRGNWNGKTILPAAFVDEAGKNQVPTAGRSTFLHGRYGLYWWTNDVMPNGKRPWPDAPPRAYTAHGHGSNFCFILPEWNMVIVRMGTVPIGRTTQGDPLWNGFFAILAEAVER